MQRGTDVDKSLLALLGIMHIATYVPLENTLPPERLNAIIHDANIKAILTTPSLKPQLQKALSSPSPHIYTWDEIPSDTSRSFPVPQNQQSQADDVAYILYTSGTSQGLPKGVMISHRSLAHFALTFNQTVGITLGDRSSQFFSLSFDASFAEIVALAAGATLYPIPSPIHFGGDALITFIREQALTVMHGIPSLIQKLPPLTSPELRLLILGGEVCPASLIQRHHHPGLQIINACGLTETTVCYSLGICSNDGQLPSIGYPLPDCHISIRDEALQLVPPGTPGQICVAGDCLALGYTNDTLTQERFISDPLSPSQRIFLTGDEGTMSATGEIHFLGRQDADRRLKIAGKLVSLDEIESLLLQHPQIEDCALEFINNRIIAYVSLHSHETNRREIPQMLNTFLHQYAPDYMLPKAYVLLAQFPRNKSDKIDRLKLQSLPLQSWMFAAYNEPRQAQSETEKRLASIIATMLNQQAEELAMLSSLLETEETAPTQEDPIEWDAIDVSRPASELGLESLQAPDFTTLVKQRTEVDIPFQEFFVPIATLAASIDQRQGKEDV
jgi:amino acid adenylation domain-containing protein